MGNPFFCQIAAAYFSGLTAGTSATTYSPTAPVTREQMAAFVSRTLDQSLKRGSRRAVLKQWATPSALGQSGLEVTLIDALPQLVECDGTDLWVANQGSGTVSRVRASNGSLVGTFWGATNPTGVLVTYGYIWVTGFTNPGRLHFINPKDSTGAIGPGFVVGASPLGIATDGAGIWTANNSGSVSILSLSTITITTVSAGFSAPVRYTL
jgi:hypothetical protein